MTVVETERLVLRPWRAGDIDGLAALFADPQVSQFPFGRGLTRQESQRFLDRHLRHWDEHGFGSWAVSLRDEPGLIGSTGLATATWLPEVMPAVEVGWRFHPSYWGRGLATEAGRASLRYGFDVVGLERIIAIYVIANVASGRVMERLGMTPCGTATDPTFGVPLEIREITADAWRARDAAARGCGGPGG